MTRGPKGARRRIRLFSHPDCHRRSRLHTGSTRQVVASHLGARGLRLVPSPPVGNRTLPRRGPTVQVYEAF
jgi:hypothetical protein